MRAKIDKVERYPTLHLEASQIGPTEPGAKDSPNIPPDLITNLQRAQVALKAAEHAVLVHLIKTQQYFSHVVTDKVARDPDSGERHFDSIVVLPGSMSESEMINWVDDLDAELGAPYSDWSKA